MSNNQDRQRDPAWHSRYERKRKDRARSGPGLPTLLYLLLLFGLAFAVVLVIVALQSN